MPLPVTITYTDENVPEWIAVIKEIPENPFSLQITLETYDNIKFVTSNIESLLIDLPKAIQDTGLSVSDVQAIIAFLRFTAQKLTITIDGTGSDTYEIILPPGVSVINVRKVTGESIPFFFNIARNSVVFTVQFASVEVVEILVSSITNMLNRALSSIVTVILVASVLQTVFRELGSVFEEVRR